MSAYLGPVQAVLADLTRTHPHLSAGVRSDPVRLAAHASVHCAVCKETKETVFFPEDTPEDPRSFFIVFAEEHEHPRPEQSEIKCAERIRRLREMAGVTHREVVAAVAASLAAEAVSFARENPSADVDVSFVSQTAVDVADGVLLALAGGDQS